MESDRRTLRDLTCLTLITLIITALVWIPHQFRLNNFFNLDFSQGFSTIYRNFDGLEYIVIAKSLYNPQLISTLPLSLPANYYAAHFPGFPLLVLFFAPLLGFLKSMLFVSLLSTAAAACAFYFLVRDFKLTTQPVWLTTAFLILPARWLIVHSVGSAEPTFILFVILALYFFMKFEGLKQAKFIYLSAFFGLLAQLTRPPGILLFLALALYVITKSYLGKKNIVKELLKYYPLLMIPLSLLAIFYLFQQTLGSFWAYFQSGDNIHLTLPPFAVFNKHQFWVGEIWLEDIIYIFLLGFLGGLMLLKQRLYALACFVLTYLAATVFVAHRDISRYALPVFPFVLIAFEKVVVSKEFKIALAIVSLAIYLYAQNFILENTAPVANLTPLN